MTNGAVTIDVDVLVDEIALVGEVLAKTKPNQPAWRWLEYQAYMAFVSHAEAKHEIPEGYQVFKPDAKSVRDWIAGRNKKMAKDLGDELVRLLTAMADAGSDIIKRLCEAYCAAKKGIGVGFDAATVVLNGATIKAILLAYSGDLLYAGGVPVTAFAALLLRLGVLEKLCDCP
jgi:hypothetical protein